MREFENQNHHAAAAAPFVASKTSTSQSIPPISAPAGVWFCGEFHMLPGSIGSQTAIFARTPHKEPWYAALTQANTNSMSVLHHYTWVSSNKPKQLNSHHPLAAGVSWSLKSKEDGLQISPEVALTQIFLLEAFICCLGYCKVSYMGIPAGGAEGIQQIGWV